MKAKMALIREAGTERDLRQPELAVYPQEVLRSFNAARNHILVRRQPRGCLELSCEMIRAEMDDGRHLFQLWTAFEIFHDVLNDRAELVVWEHTVRRRRLGAGDMTD
jgi:hypothetical protein